MFLAHPWIVEDGEAPDIPLGNAVLGRLKQFRAMNKFKKVALRVPLRGFYRTRDIKKCVNRVFYKTLVYMTKHKNIRSKSVAKKLYDSFGGRKRFFKIFFK